MRWITLGLIVVLLVNTHSDALASQPGLSTHTALIAALQQGSIDSAIQLIKTITKPQPDDLQPLSMGVRLMLDHLYIVDASDLTMPSVKAKMDEALHTAELAILADPAALDGWCAKALALNWAYRYGSNILTAQHLWLFKPRLRRTFANMRKRKICWIRL